MKNLYLVEGVGFYLVKGFIHYSGEIASGVYSFAMADVCSSCLVCFLSHAYLLSLLLSPTMSLATIHVGVLHVSAM